ncbi:ATP-binding cassette domain-containing protein [Pimelobacter simplex]|uniref:Putative ABC transporter ATP-binding protein n=1 Tax=Nocardioides simplex TaxID=2045 RepID=A0A0C5XH48_NOCSI|nr:ABC transporter ATP-binding protein [Pimelobacter simplex]AJR18446.1 putative ABC transporter ATP-binding protein [Pimelobacter simplex]MCG8150085.1 ATP-binding cassette domain-containing protein [Pimelobacter simplex]GEB13706.1 multidrug ABC transporter ATP-binding protein [Pimelobacter simplex]SFM69694.1 ABC-2 type transport system ATP-binding protein [Pimelobacter simplex]
MTSPAIQVRGLRRSYGSGATAYEAVRGVDLDVPAGTLTALLGTNGAGKTSTMEVVEGLCSPSAGEVRVLGLDPVAARDQVRRRTGTLLQTSGFSGDLTVDETLRMWAGTLTAPRPLAEVVDLLRLGHRADVAVRALSGGERRRLDLACALMGRPEVLLLDEPTTGLDPESRRDVWALVRSLRDAGTTVLLTTHYLEEAEALADRLEIMHAGRIVRSGTAAEVVAGHPSHIRLRTTSAPAWLDELPAGRGVITDGGRTTVETDALQETLTALLVRAGAEGLRLDDLEARHASLESVFLAIADGTHPATTTTTTPEPEAALR